MKVLLLGHSYVRDLKNYCERNGCYYLKENGVEVELLFDSIPGATYDTFLQLPLKFKEISYIKPDVVLTVLGGNDIKVNCDLAVVKNQCRSYFEQLRQSLPDEFLVTLEVESRYLRETNKHGTPEVKRYRIISNYFNSWLKKQRFKDWVVCIRGSGRLCKREFV